MNKVQLTSKEQFDRLFPIYFYRRHLDLAAIDLLGLDLSPHHRMILRDWGRGKPINMFFASRGTGKSVLMAIFFVLMATLYPKLKLVVVGGQGFRGSKMIMMECEAIIRGDLMGQRSVGYVRYSCRDSRKIILKDPAYWIIILSNGSTIKGVPLGMSSDGAGIRGTRAHILGRDEAFLIPHKLFQAVLEPMQNVLYEPHKNEDEQMLRNMDITVSTCDFDFRDFYKQFLYYKSVLCNEELDDPDVKDITEGMEIVKEDISLFNFDLDDSYYIYNGKRKTMWGIDYARIMKKKHLPTTDIDLWMSENKNIPLNIQGGYFPFGPIDAGMNIELISREESEKTAQVFPELVSQCSAPCMLGIDNAPSDDNSAFVVIKAGTYNSVDRDNKHCLTAAMGGKCPMLHKGECTLGKRSHVVYAFEGNKLTQREKIEKIYELMGRYNIVAIGMDSRGGGFELESLLMDEAFISGLDPLYTPIYDPERFTLSYGLPILTLYSTTQAMNMEFNAYMKGLMSNQHLIFPRPLHGKPDDPWIFESAGHVETLISQVARIKALPAGAGVKFIIETIDPNSGLIVPAKKDLYSALLYANAKMKHLIDEQVQDDTREALPIAQAVAFNL